MPQYRRAFVPGGTFFLTFVTNFRRPILISALSRRLLRTAITDTQAEHPFEIDAVALLPDHIHWIWTLPDGETDFSTRMRLMKGRFTHAFLSAGGREAGRSRSRRRHAERSVWHRRFWEHTVRSWTEFGRICDYIHYNPVKHCHAACPHAWPYSSFHRLVTEGRYAGSWSCVCDGSSPTLPNLDDIGPMAGE